MVRVRDRRRSRFFWPQILSGVDLINSRTLASVDTKPSLTGNGGMNSPITINKIIRDKKIVDLIPNNKRRTVGKNCSLNDDDNVIHYTIKLTQNITGLWPRVYTYKDVWKSLSFTMRFRCIDVTYQYSAVMKSCREQKCKDRSHVLLAKWCNTVYCWKQISTQLEWWEELGKKKNGPPHWRLKNWESALDD